MRIKIWTSVNPEFPNTGPYKSLDIVEREKPHAIGEMTHYGPVIALPPFADEESNQSVIVQLRPDSLNTRPHESVLERPPFSYGKIQLFPIHVSSFWHPDYDEPPPDNPSVVLETNNLTVEEAFDNCGDWMGAFVIGEILGEHYADEVTLTILARLAKTASLLTRQLLLHALEYFAKATRREALRNLAIQQLQELGKSESEEVREEAFMSLAKLGAKAE